MRNIFLVVILLCSCIEQRATGNASTENTTPTVPVYGYSVKRVFAHNPQSYTQGLLWHEGYLMESTGQYGESSVMKIDINTGKCVQRTDLPDKYFGEGMTAINGKLYQLTWQEQTLHIYDLKSLKNIGEIKYQGEGWGLTNDSTHLYMSNGSDKIYVRDPQTFDILRTIEVRNQGGRVTLINELEWIEGEIWANIFMSDLIVRIDPLSGKVTGIIDLEGLLPQSDRTPTTDVLNGIAYDKATRKIYVTGKNWSKLFEIELTKK